MTDYKLNVSVELLRTSLFDRSKYSSPHHPMTDCISRHVILNCQSTCMCYFVVAVGRPNALALISPCKILFTNDLSAGHDAIRFF